MMNEQALALYQYALEFAYENVGKEDSDKPYFQAIVAGKFAELIVLECAEVGLDSVEDGDDLDAIMKRVHNNILKHFGVES
jgi:hypothetical protein